MVRPARPGRAGPRPARVAGRGEDEGLQVLPGVDSLRDVGPDAALTALYATHYASLVRLAALLLDDPAAGEEVAQDAYVRVHGAWGRLRDAESGLAYLRRTVVNIARSRLRRRRVAEAVSLDRATLEESAESGALALLERRAVVGALRRLPTRQRETLVLRYWAGLSEAEIAAALGVSRGAVKSHASRGLSALRVALDAGPDVLDGGDHAARGPGSPVPDGHRAGTRARRTP